MRRQAQLELGGNALPSKSTKRKKRGAKPVISGVQRMSRDQYDKLERVNWSTLKHMDRSPAHYLHAVTAVREDTDAMKLGRAIHMAVFEPEQFRASIAVWDGGTRRGKDWDDFRARNEGRELLTEAAYEQCMTVQRAVRNSAMASKWVSGGVAEATLLWTHKVPALEALPAIEIECRGRVDFIANAGGVVDLKTTRDASPEAFARQFWNLGHQSQCAFYADGHLAATGANLPFIIIAAEVAEPFVVQVYQVPDSILKAGREKYRDLLAHLALCREQSAWPGYSVGELVLEPPRWAMDDDDVTGLDLVVNE